jgi:hypothetical protein
VPLAKRVRLLNALNDPDSCSGVGSGGVSGGGGESGGSGGVGGGGDGSADGGGECEKELQLVTATAGSPRVCVWNARFQLLRVLTFDEDVAGLSVFADKLLVQLASGAMEMWS